MTRPASFDAQLVNYMPGLRALASRLRPRATPDERADLVQSTLCRALASWQSYRPGNSPYTWLQFIMRDISRTEIERNQKTAEFKLRLSGVSHTITPPNQEHAAELSLALGRIAPDLLDDMLAVAQGAPMAEPAAMRNTSRQRVDQLFRAERERLAALSRRADARRDVAYGRV